MQLALEPPLVPPLAMAVYITCFAGISALINCAVASALLKHSRNGLFSIIIQLAITDIILLGTSIAPELWSCNARKWHFGSNACIAYRGLNVFASTASLYLVITIGFHTLTSINIEEKARKKRNCCDDNEEMRSSRHSLVANSDSSTPPRTMNIDYRPIDRVSVILPIVFVWILSASLSVPEFVLATTASQQYGLVLCGIIESNHHTNMHLLLAVFSLILPALMMSTACTLIILKLKNINKLLHNVNLELIAALKLSLGLIIVYVVLCVPRSIFIAYRVYASSLSQNDESLLDLSLQKTITALSLASSSAYLVATLVRPLLYIFLIPRLRKIFLFQSRIIDINV